MRSSRAVLCLAALFAPAAAQAQRDVPVEQDLRRERRIERDIDRNRPPASDPSSPDPFVTPDNPDGVVGFDGPPDPMDDGVDDGSPLPPGSPAAPD